MVGEMDAGLSIPGFDSSPTVSATLANCHGNWVGRMEEASCSSGRLLSHPLAPHLGFSQQGMRVKRSSLPLGSWVALKMPWLRVLKRERRGSCCMLLSTNTLIALKVADLSAKICSGVLC